LTRDAALFISRIDINVNIDATVVRSNCTHAGD